jgi:hypothetical protein
MHHVATIITSQKVQTLTKVSLRGSIELCMKEVHGVQDQEQCVTTYKQENVNKNSK